MGEALVSDDDDWVADASAVAGAEDSDDEEDEDSDEDTLLLDGLTLSVEDD